MLGGQGREATSFRPFDGDGDCCVVLEPRWPFNWRQVYFWRSPPITLATLTPTPTVMPEPPLQPASPLSSLNHCTPKQPTTTNDTVHRAHGGVWRRPFGSSRRLRLRFGRTQNVARAWRAMHQNACERHVLGAMDCTISAQCGGVAATCHACAHGQRHSMPHHCWGLKSHVPAIENASSSHAARPHRGACWTMHMHWTSLSNTPSLMNRPPLLVLATQQVGTTHQGLRLHLSAPLAFGRPPVQSAQPTRRLASAARVGSRGGCCIRVRPSSGRCWLDLTLLWLVTRTCVWSTPTRCVCRRCVQRNGTVWGSSTRPGLCACM